MDTFMYRYYLLNGIFVGLEGQHYFLMLIFQKAFLSNLSIFNKSNLKLEGEFNLED